MDSSFDHSQHNELIIPVDIAMTPSWWYKNAGITFDEDFFYHSLRRVESEQKMEQVLYDRWGQFGLGQAFATDRCGSFGGGFFNFRSTNLIFRINLQENCLGK